MLPIFKRIVRKSSHYGPNVARLLLRPELHTLSEYERKHTKPQIESANFAECERDLLSMNQVFKSSPLYYEARVLSASEAFSILIIIGFEK